MTACGGKNTGNHADIAIQENTSSGNYLFMKINGREWMADNEISEAFHPEGYNNAFMIAGDKEPKDKNHQTFNINLYNTSGPGIFQIENGNKDKNVIQLAGLSEQNFLYGSMMGFNVKVNIIKASKNPIQIKATFEGEMMGNASDQLFITEGKFYYHE